MKRKNITNIKPGKPTNISGREGKTEEEAMMTFEELEGRIRKVPVVNINETSRPRKILYSIFPGLGIFFLLWGIITLLPTEIAPWHGELTTKPNSFGYVAHCPFSPISSLILIIISAFFFYPLRRLFKDVKSNRWYIIAGILIAIAEIYFGIFRNLF